MQAKQVSAKGLGAKARLFASKDGLQGQLWESGIFTTIQLLET
jgi:hypothetical protein